jgi:hypothetical protein
MIRTIIVFSFLPWIQGQCPNANEKISWTGPCTQQSILSSTGCDMNNILNSMEELQEACDAAAL